MDKLLSRTSKVENVWMILTHNFQAFQAMQEPDVMVVSKNRTKLNKLMKITMEKK